MRSTSRYFSFTLSASQAEVPYPTLPYRRCVRVTLPYPTGAVCVFSFSILLSSYAAPPSSLGPVVCPCVLCPLLLVVGCSTENAHPDSQNSNLSRLAALQFFAFVLIPCVVCSLSPSCLTAGGAWRLYSSPSRINCPDEEMARRIVERGKGSGRADDHAEAAKVRIDTYHQQSTGCVRRKRNRSGNRTQLQFAHVFFFCVLWGQA